jgi:hypothetical protein
VSACQKGTGAQALGAAAGVSLPTSSPVSTTSAAPLDLCKALYCDGTSAILRLQTRVDDARAGSRQGSVAVLVAHSSHGCYSPRFAFMEVHELNACITHGAEVRLLSSHHWLHTVCARSPAPRSHMCLVTTLQCQHNPLHEIRKSYPSRRFSIKLSCYQRRWLCMTSYKDRRRVDACSITTCLHRHHERIRSP